MVRECVVCRWRVCMGGGVCGEGVCVVRECVGGECVVCRWRVCVVRECVW